MIRKLRKDITPGEVFKHREDSKIAWIAIGATVVRAWDYCHVNLDTWQLSGCHGHTICYVLEAHEL